MIIGTDLVTKSLPSKKVSLVIYTSDASQNTEKKVTDKCKFYGVECIKADCTADILSNAIGKSGSVCVLGITGQSFSKELKKLIRGA